ncbi:HAUS augmin-like complex subunit 8 isoform X2 [Myxocyprinus asiaticus]|uniref:HAUS augmin-like complex subunit 8 isoform X2 n=1 Tax=Myxocyprinus asiaticus TaxID=70543 RepID=UPI0022215355|nr:HAUS augmin-like complex subunit 8 isoform X2 [Myxocyprinus asiaticus]
MRCGAQRNSCQHVKHRGRKQPRNGLTKSDHNFINMASKKLPAVRKVEKTSSDSKNSSTDNEANSGNNSGARRKTKTSGTIVKSRYMQTEPKAPAKNSVQQQSILVPPKPSSPRVSSTRNPRESIQSRRTLSTPADHNATLMTSILESSNMGGNILQSTVLDGHCIRPDFDVSVIKDKVAPPSTVDPKNDERDMAMETFLLAFLTAKIEHKNRKLREEAEKNILTVMEKEQQLRAQVNRKKRQCMLWEKQKQINNLLDLQIEALGPIAAASNKFSEEYKSFATAIDATRHKLPVKNVHIGEDTGQFLDKAVGCLNESEHDLQQYTRDVPTDCEASAECLGEMKNAAHEISQQLTKTFSELLEVSSLVRREKVLVQTSLEEDQMGKNTVQTLFCSSMS